MGQKRTHASQQIASLLYPLIALTGKGTGSRAATKNGLRFETGAL